MATAEKRDGGNQQAGRWSLAKDMEITPERYTVAMVRGIGDDGDPTLNDDYGRIAGWMSHDETRAHLRAPIAPIKNFADKQALINALIMLGKYYNNQNVGEDGNIIEDDPRKITPIIAANGLGEAIGVAVIRWKGSPYVEEEDLGRIASIESVIVEPSLQTKLDSHKYGVGKRLVAAALEIIFNSDFKPYNKKSADAVRVWVFTDSKAGDYRRNLEFFRRFGFLPVGGKEGDWKKYCEARNIPYDGREGQWLQLTKDDWNNEKRTPKFNFDTKIDMLTLRRPIPVLVKKPKA